MIRALSREELLALLGAARAARERDFLMILVAFSHGLRASEVISLKARDISDGHLRAKRLKHSLTTVQPLIENENPLLNEKKALLEYMAEMHADQVLFPVTRRRFHQLMREHGATARIPAHKRTPHCLKHTTGRFTIGLGIDVCQQWLGHRSMASTGVYAKIAEEEAGARVSAILKT